MRSMANRIPPAIKAALIARNEAREALRQREAELQTVIDPLAGTTFTIEGVPFKVCGTRGKRYVRRIVGPEETEKLREKWRNDG
jgi:hypothetical protein